MAFNVNTVAVSGRVTRQAELKAENFLTFTIAVNNTKKDANGEWVNDPAFIDCTVSGARANALVQRLQKGAHVVVDGSIWQNNWVTKDGQKRSKLQVKVKNLDLLQDNKDGSSYSKGTANSSASNMSDDDIPF